MKRILYCLAGLVVVLMASCGRMAESKETNQTSVKQGRARIDSLERALASFTVEDTNKVKVFFNLAFLYSTVDTEKGIMYGRRAALLSKKLNWRKGTAQAYNSIGTNYLNSAAPAEAVVMFDSALATNKEIRFVLGQAVNYRNMGIARQELGNLGLAKKDFETSLHLYQTLNNTEGIIGAHCNLGAVLLDEEKYAEALEKFGKANELAEKSDSKKNLVVGYNNCSFANCELGKLDEAEAMARLGLGISNELKDNYGLNLSYKNLGAVEMRRGNYREAAEYFRMSLHNARLLGSAYRQSQAYLYLGENAMRWWKEVQRSANIHPTGPVPSSLALVQPDTALRYCWKSLELANKNDSKSVLKTLDLMEEGYGTLGDKKSATACEKLASRLEKGDITGHPAQELKAARK